MVSYEKMGPWGLIDWITILVDSPNPVCTEVFNIRGEELTPITSELMRGQVSHCMVELNPADFSIGETSVNYSLLL